MRIAKLLGPIGLLAISACLGSDSESSPDEREKAEEAAEHARAESLATAQLGLESGLCGNIAGLQANAPWPMFGGCPTHAAQSSQYGPTGNQKNWSTYLWGNVKSSPAVAADGSIYVGSDFGKVFKINRANGSIVKQALLFGSVHSSPALGADGTIYVGSDFGGLYALDPSTLNTKWSYSVAGGVGSSPAIGADGTLYVGGGDFKLYALNPNGTKKWSYATGFAINNSPAIGADGTIYIGSDVTLYALNPNGTKKWSKAIGFPITSSPAVGRFGRVYIGGGDKLTAVDTATGTLVWQKSLGSCTIYAPAIGANGVVYVGTGFSLFTGGALYAVGPDGDILWHFDVFGGVQSTPIIDKAGNLYFGANDNKVYAVDATGNQLWKFSTLGNVQSSPALDTTGAVIVGANDNNLYSIGVGATRVPNGGACTSDAQCVPGLVCGVNNGARFGLAAGTRACWVPTCENKIQDPGETEVDCGGACGSCTNVCSLACKLGDQVQAPALEVLSFSKASFIRPTFGTYQVGAQQSLAGGNTLRFEDRADGSGRLALFEGTRTNNVVFSEQLGHAPEWHMPSGGTPIVESDDYAQSPEGDPTADRMNAPAGGYPSRTQTLNNNVPAGVLSAWLRLTDPAGAASATRAVLADSQKRWYSSTTPWTLTGTWERKTMPTTATTCPVDLSFSHKAAWPGNATTFPQLGAADFLAWGIQLEEGTFASSYIPTADDPETRTTDRLVFESADVPAWIRTGLWQLDVAPIFASTDIATSDEMTLVAWENGQLTLGRDSAGGVLKIVSGTATSKLSIDWVKNTKLTVTLDFGAHTLAVRGATRGDGSVGTGSMTIPVGRLAVGARLDESSGAFARISEPRRVSVLTVACVSDPDCIVCGDGFITGNEHCDPVLDAGCKADCTGPITNASTELSCKDHADNDGDGLIDCADVVDCNLDPACRATVGGTCIKDFDCAKSLVCASGACLAPQCENGVKDANEQGTDCGGPCAACNGRQCGNVCRPGTDVSPPAQATLAFSSGTFSRSTTATFEGPTGDVETARLNELRWVHAAGQRLALFEGASTNVLKWSEALDHAPDWSAPGSAPMSVTPNAGTDPTGVATAELLSSPNGPSRSPVQTAALPAASSVLSFWLGGPTGTTQSNAFQEVRVFATPASGAVASATWQVLSGWTRADVPVNGNIGAATGISFSDVAGFPNGSFSERTSADFYAWGAQLEAQSFPTSYVPSAGGGSVRAADVLTFASLPNWVTSGQWQIDVAPLFASKEMRADWRYTLISFGSTYDIALVAGSGGTAKLVIRHAGGTYNSPDLKFARGAVLSVTLDIAGDKLTVEGETTGEGTYPVAGLAISATSMRVGGALGAQGEAFAAISEPRQVVAATAACALDASCSCGNGALDNGELCDPGLDAHCAGDCGSKEPVTCQSDDDCGGGSVCGVDNGPRFNLDPATRVCWPGAICTASAATNCGPTSPCGDCICVPDCSHAVCGASTSDGCGGICDGTCGNAQPGCTLDEECGPGYACGEGQAGSFGLSAGANVCWPDVCEDPNQRLKHCGTANALCGSTCPQFPNTCDARVCGTDDHGNDCGQCPTGESCDPFGQCFVLAEFTKNPPPLPGPADLVDDPPADEAGALFGDFSVDANGAATYSIPIDVPPGPAGFAPKLTLQYTSTSGNGFVGKGWSLTGLSAITRCPRTFAQHGYAKGVDLSENDALCLDGKLLVPVGGSESNGSMVYRTELDSFVTVTSIGNPFVAEGQRNVYTGPTSFIVSTKEGHFLRYGQTSNSRIETWFDSATTSKSHPVHMSWLLDETVDTSANKIAVTYKPQSQDHNGFEYTGEVQPETIAYGAEYSVQVRLEYDDDTANWSVRSFRAGVGRQFSSPIKTISTWVNNGQVPTQVRSYRLENELRNNEWLLKSVTACAPSDVGERCLPPTVFTYNPVEDNLSLLATTTDEAGHIPTSPNYQGKAFDAWEPENLDHFNLIALDAQGDGREDILHDRFEMRGKKGSRADGTNPDPPYYYIRESQPLSGAQKAFNDGGRIDWPPLGLADFDGDGHADYYYVSNIPFIFGTIQLTSIVANGRAIGSLPPVEHSDNPFQLIMDTMAAVDADGDGHADIYQCKEDDDGDLRLILHQNNGGPQAIGFNPGPSILLEHVGSAGPQLSCKNRIIADYDGDGIENLILVEYSDKGHYDHDQRPHMFAVSYVNLWDGPKLVLEDIGDSPFVESGALENFRLLDVNGDGLLDIVHPNKKKIPWLYLSTGRGFRYAGLAPKDGHYDQFEFSFVMDVDSDGRQELLIPSKEEGWVIHTPYSVTGVTDPPWKTRRASMPFQWVHSVKKHPARREHYDAFGYQAPHVLDWDADGVQEVVTRRAPPSDPDDVDNPVFELWKAAPRTRSLLATITDGIGKKIEVGYDSAPSTYVSGTCTYPQKCLKVLPEPVVTSHTVSGAAGSFEDGRSLSQSRIVRTTEYQYEDARTDLRGRGWLGFRKRTVNEFADPGRLVRSTIYDYALGTKDDAHSIFPFAGYPATVDVTEFTGLSNDLQTRTLTVNNWDLRTSADGLPYVALGSGYTAMYENSADTVGAVVSIEQRSYSYDGFGNRTYANTNWTDGRGVTTQTTYVDDTDADWTTYRVRGLVGLIKSQTVTGTSNVAGAESKSYQVEFTYDSDGRKRGLPATATRSSMLNGLPLQTEQITTLTYDNFGNENSRELSGRSVITQKYFTDYGDRGVAPVEAWDSVHQASQLHTKIGVDLRTGLAQWVVRPDGSWTVVNRDAFGREVTSFDSVGTSSTTSYFNGGLLGGTLTVRTLAAGKPNVVTEYNAFGLAVAKRSTEWDPQSGAPVTRMEELGYDSRGRLVAQGTSHVFDTPSPSAHYYYYDDSDRVTLEVAPWVNAAGEVDTVETEHTYATKLIPSPSDDVGVDWASIPEGVRAHKRRVVAPDGASSVSVSDVRGNVVAAVDSLATVTRHVFGALDYPVSTQVAGDTTSYVTNEIGKVTSLKDPDVGQQDYFYDGLGQLLTYTRNQQTTSYQYDALGRKTHVTSPDGTYVFLYDGDGSDPTLTGHLQSQTVTSATIGNASTSYEYKNPGATVSAIHRVVEGQTFDTRIEPDELGRRGILRFPGPGDRPLAVRYHYEPNYGRLDSIVEDVSNQPLWSLKAIDGFGNASELQYAAGQKVSRHYQPATGKVDGTAVARADGSNFLSIGLTYDQRGLLRVRSTRIDGAAATSESFVHDALDRLKTRVRGDGVTEQYDYDLKGNLTLSPTAGVLHYEDALHPHQVTRTDDGRSFAYVDGNQNTRTGASLPGGEQHIAYSAFDLPITVTNGSLATPTGITSFHYDASHKRVAQLSTDGSRVLYAGDLYRQTEKPGAATEYTARVPTPDGLVIEATLKPDHKHEFRFLQTDYLGSVLSVSDQDGTRLGNTAAYSPFGVATDPADSWGGFTGHEDDAAIGLVNMRGRMYDPQLGRFLSADPIVANPLNSQNWNRYSYVSNSPLNAIDPSGFEEDGGIGMSYGEEAISIYEPQGNGVGAIEEESGISVSRVGSTPLSSEGGMCPNGGAAPVGEDVVSPAYAASEPSPGIREEGERGTMRASGSSLGGALLNVGIAAGIVGASTIPWVGESMDVYTLFAPDSAWWERGLSVASLGASVLSAGFLPNFGALRAADDVAEVAARGESEVARVFWSGGRGAEDAAAQFAGRTGGTTLEMTAQGRALQAADLPWSEAKPLWENASREFVEGASGRVDVFIGKTPRADSIWSTIEKPALQGNPSVTGIRVHLPVVP